MITFKQFVKENEGTLSQHIVPKDIRGRIPRAGDYVYIPPQTIKEFDAAGTFIMKRLVRAHDFLSNFKVPFAYVLTNNSTGKSDGKLMLNNVRIVREDPLTIFKQEKFRGHTPGRFAVMKVSDVIVLTPQELRNLPEFLKNINTLSITESNNDKSPIISIIHNQDHPYQKIKEDNEIIVKINPRKFIRPPYILADLNELYPHPKSKTGWVKYEKIFNRYVRLVKNKNDPDFINSFMFSNFDSNPIRIYEKNKNKYIIHDGTNRISAAAFAGVDDIDAILTSIYQIPLDNIKEEYTYMYGNAKVDKMPLYDALVLAHEIEYKWHKLKNGKQFLEKSFLETLVPIFERYKGLLLNACKDWIYSHIFLVPYDFKSGQKSLVDGHFMTMKEIMMDWYLGENSEGSYTNMIFDNLNKKYGIKKPEYFKGDDYYDMVTEYINSIPENIINKISIDHKNGLIFKPVYDAWLNLQPLDEEDEDAYVTNGIINARDLLLSNSNQNIDEIMKRITLTLNIQHNNGNILSDYIIKIQDRLSKKQLNQLSNLPVRRWDKELEEEFGPEVLQGYRAFGK